MTKTLAQIDLGQLRGLGPLGLETFSSGTGVAPSLFNLFISGVIGLMTVIALLWFTFNFIIGAIGIITSGGDKGKLESARERLTTGIIGVVVVVAAIFLVQLVGSLIGIGNIILRPTEIIDFIAPKAPAS